MKTFKEFLAEELSQEAIDKIADDIVTNCKPFIDDVGVEKLFNLFRGQYRVNKSGLDVFITRTDRKPRDSNLKFHETIDRFFEDRFGVRFRSQSVFTTATPDDAELYGTLCSFLPIGKYKACWSEYFADAITIQHPTSKQFSDMIREIGDKNGKDSKQYKNVTELKTIFENEFKASKSLFNAAHLIFSQHKDAWFNAIYDYLDAIDAYVEAPIKQYFANPKSELMVACDKFYLIDHDFLMGIYSDLIKAIKNRLNVNESVNPKVFKKGFNKKVDILDGAYTLTAMNGYIPYGSKELTSKQFRIEAKTKSGELAGWVNFEQVGDHLEAIDLVVKPAHTRKGVATEMYKLARTLNNDIKPSSLQTGMGKLFWNKDHSK